MASIGLSPVGLIWLMGRPVRVDSLYNRFSEKTHARVNLAGHHLGILRAGAAALLSLLALPRLAEAGLDDRTSVGQMTAPVALAILPPPSVMRIILGDQLKTPVPSMFA